MALLHLTLIDRVSPLTHGPAGCALQQHTAKLLNCGVKVQPAAQWYGNLNPLYLGYLSQHSD